MEFKVNPASFSGIFPVPTAVVDENIRLASVVQLKVILYLLRHGSVRQVTVKDISDALFLDSQDVADALRSGKIRSAAVDVVSQEPILATNPLLTAPNCIITPHMAWAPIESRQRIIDCTVASMQAFLDGKPINEAN